MGWNGKRQEGVEREGRKKRKKGRNEGKKARDEYTTIRTVTSPEIFSSV